MRVPVVEDELPVDVAEVILAGVLHAPLGRQLGVQRRAGDGRVEHELVEIGIVADGVLDGLVDVFRRVVLQADDRRAQHADAVRLQLAHQGEGVDALQLGVLAVAAFHAHPHPGDAQADKLLDRVGAETLAELKTYSDQALSCCRINSSRRRARLRWRRKFSSMTKNEETFMSRSSWHMTSNSSSPVW